MNGLHVFCATLGKGEMVIADKQKGSLVIYPDGSQSPVVNLKSTVDIIILRDLLNDAFSPEVYKIEKVRGVPKRSVV